MNKALTVLLAVFFLMGACASRPEAASDAAEAEKAGDSIIEVDEAIRRTSDYFSRNIPAGTKIALIGVDAYSEELSDYVIGVLGNHLGDLGKYEMIERQNTKMLVKELNFQAAGYVDDQSAQRIGHMSGAEVIIYGKIAPQGKAHLLTISASGVQSAAKFQRFYPVRLDADIFAPAQNVQADLDRAIAKAVNDLGKDISSRLAITTGRITRIGDDSATTFSVYLNNKIMASALQQGDSYYVESQRTPRTMATIDGDFVKHGNNIEVSLHLTSTAPGNAWLGSARFTVPEDELNRRNISVYTSAGDTIVSEEQYQRKQNAIALYNPENNPFEFSVASGNYNGIFYEGDPIDFVIKTQKECYIKISHVNVLGRIKNVYPTSEEDLETNHLLAGGTWRLSDYFDTKVKRPFGEDIFLVAAYDGPIPIQALYDEDLDVDYSETLIAESLKPEGINFRDVDLTKRKNPPKRTNKAVEYNGKIIAKNLLKITSSAAY